LGIAAHAPTFAPGSTFAGYRIDELAGRGGMGVVFRATQVALGRPVALKLIATAYAADDAFRERFKREWETAAAIASVSFSP
jgi:serine/threonine-protein kinase